MKIQFVFIYYKKADRIYMADYVVENEIDSYIANNVKTKAEISIQPLPISNEINNDSIYKVARVWDGEKFLYNVGVKLCQG